MSAAAADVPPPHHHHPTSSTSRGSPQQLLSRHSPQPHITYAHYVHIYHETICMWSMEVMMMGVRERKVTPIFSGRARKIIMISDA